MYESEVDAGIRHLNFTLPFGWFNQVDCATLNMAQANICVLGQTVGYVQTLSERGHDWMLEHGFTLPYQCNRVINDHNWAELTLTWVRAIKRLQDDAKNVSATTSTDLPGGTKIIFPNMIDLVQWYTDKDVQVTLLQPPSSLTEPVTVLLG